MGSIRSALDTVRFIQKESCLGIYQTTSTLPKKGQKSIYLPVLFMRVDQKQIIEE